MNNIAVERQKLGLSQSKLAHSLGWGRSRLSNYESNLREPGLSECRLIVETLNRLGAKCSLDSVFPSKPEKLEGN
ncbi:helix-turn-helix transcriptional regulator [Enterobacter hormaechei]|uniref:helix-turn-helix domain-containing protein n=1 Tax=Enterobacter cloacae complex TaxID=354276 RepID=UPI000907F921|nr:helix-turn-helix transcriptional regulator [Enterobacter hormaechei]AWS78576.1 XRE family transcriptional regulator [Enterobacter cloacae complex sp.]HCJ6305604.1 helix-turn-helix transcriptional regulator [Enterobacter hormaechei subsp. xiangfangensis]HCR1977695.1 helix-turn-helix transcriptional regulator [Enterobacter hormaechei subsp. steigerwaltii]AXO43566.1 XRE family transcriptional regulator [Enterobacter hormaechei]ELC6381979.1 helix-turn-helix transcriptional regulator [Enterobact